MRRATLLILFLALTPFADVTAQQSSPLEPGQRVWVLETESAAAWQASGTAWLPATIAAASLDTTLVVRRLQIRPEQGRKNPTTAGLLSGTCLLLPVCGLGSFYVGNAGHGWRHLGIGLGTWGAMFAGYAAGDCRGFGACEPEGAGVAVFVVGAIGYTANAVWSIIVAGNEAHAHNQRSGKSTAVLAPRVEFGAPLPSDVMGTRRPVQTTVTLPLVRVTF